ncbi:hypothetical protein OAL44_03355 [Planctomycetaceae bacterium]|jgi:hypothetical protein|nr:hypothetical protein [Planctomycetaceae bacterium]MDC0308152.1 hypothetical protein [Planctomycetaceae bacterium]
MSKSEDSVAITPFPLAMVICDFIYRDPYTGKYTLTGTFSAITGKDFPLHHPHLYVYAALTGGRGKIPLRIELKSADEEITIKTIDEEFEFPSDPRAIAEIAFGFQGLVFPKADEYRLALYANNEFMVERRILVLNPKEGFEDVS